MNQLYPIFLKTDRLHFLIVGGGAVGEEKLTNLLRSSPNATVRLVAPAISPLIKEIAGNNDKIVLIHEEFQLIHSEGIDIGILATDDRELNLQIRQELKTKGILVNVADTPDLCDFYMGSIVTKGDLKIAISTNGKSPTLAKRLREIFTESLPDEINDLLQQLNAFRNRLKGDFAFKVQQLNRATSSLRGEGEELCEQCPLSTSEERWQSLSSYYYLILIALSIYCDTSRDWWKVKASLYLPDMIGSNYRLSEVNFICLFL